MKIITVANQKGGVGKTFSAVVLAQLAALHGRRVVVVDMDLQQNSVDLLRDMDGSPVFQNIDVLPSALKMPDLKALAGAGYDLAIVDTPPQISTFSPVLAMVKKSDVFIIPFRLERHSLFGIENMIAMLPAGRPVLPVCHASGTLSKDREKLLHIVENQLGQKNGFINAAVILPIYSRVEFNLSERRDFYFRLTEKEFQRFEALYSALEKVL